MKEKILFLGETFRADAITWIKGIENESKVKMNTLEIPVVYNRVVRMVQAIVFIFRVIWNAVSNKKYDFVLAERSTSYGFFSLFTRAKVKIVAQQGISDIYPNKGFSKLYKKMLQRLVYKRVDIVHAWGSAMTYAQLKSGASPLKIIARPKGLDLTKYTFREHLNENQFIPQAIVTRSLLPDYRHADIIRAVAILRDMGYQIKVLIVGNGFLLAELEDLCIQLHVSELIEFKGRIDNNELPGLLKQCPIYISVPVTEGVSSSLFEAMACGCIPVVTKIPGNKAFINPGFNGELVEVASPESLAKQLMKVLESPNSYKQGIKQNRAYIENKVNREVNMAYFYERYTELLNKA